MKGKHWAKGTPFEEEYDYTDEDGQVLVTVRKYFERDATGEIVRDGTGKPKKQFRQFMNGSQGLPEPRPLYNIPNILGSDKVIWVEGEKCADALNPARIRCNMHNWWRRNVVRKYSIKVRLHTSAQTKK